MKKFKCYWVELMLVRFVLTGQAVSHMDQGACEAKGITPHGYFVGTFWEYIPETDMVLVEPSKTAFEKLMSMTNWTTRKVVGWGRDGETINCLVIPRKFCRLHSRKPFEDYRQKVEAILAESRAREALVQLNEANKKEAKKVGKAGRFFKDLRCPSTKKAKKRPAKKSEWVYTPGQAKAMKAGTGAFTTLAEIEAYNARAGKKDVKNKTKKKKGGKK